MDLELVERHLATPFEENRQHCCRGIAQILVEMGHPDLMAGLEFATDDEAREALGGSVSAGMARVLSAHGWREVDPERAPVGALGALIHDEGETAAIRIGRGWALKGRGGMRFARTVQKAWRAA